MYHSRLRADVYMKSNLNTRILNYKPFRLIVDINYGMTNEEEDSPIRYLYNTISLTLSQPLGIFA